MTEIRRPKNHDADNPRNEDRPPTKTRLRRGEIGRRHRLSPSAEVIDVIAPLNSEVEDFLCDLPREERPDYKTP